MPSKNTIRVYVKEGIYHVYNRGVEKRKIFMDDQDYRMFLYFLKRYLSPPEKPHQGITNFVQVGPGRSGREREKERGLRPCRQTDLYKEIRLLCYCLMPNHFHLMVQQLTERVISDFMRRLSNSYIKYFNEKYQRVGPLLQGRYQAALLRKEIHFLHLPYYIHRNPEKLFKEKGYLLEEKTKNYPWSSYADYAGKRNTTWLYTGKLMEQFKESERQETDFEFSKNILGKLILE